MSSLNEFYSTIKANKIEHRSKQLAPITIVLIDTLRSDYVTKEDAPFISEFLQEKSVSHLKNSRGAATSTAHSLFGLFYGMVPHLRYDLISAEFAEKFGKDWSKSRPYVQGSPFLALLKELGYSIESYGWKNIEYCVDGAKGVLPDGDGQSIFLQLNYSRDSEAFMKYCSNYGRPSSKNSGINDQEVIDRFISKFDRNSNGPILKIVRLQGVHHPYGWISKELMDPAYIAAYPFDWHIPSDLQWDVGKKSIADKTSIQNSYKNSIRSVDYEVWKLFNFLKSQNAYEDSIIFLASDHGHALMDTNDDEIADANGHGYLPYKGLTNNLFAIKWPKGEVIALNPALTTISLTDFFPTLMDFIGVDYKALMNGLPVYGESLFEKKATCDVVVQPTYDFPRPRQGRESERITNFVVDNGREKFFLQFNYKDEALTHKVTFIKHMNENDEVIKNHMSTHDLEKYLNEHFSSCLLKIYSQNVVLE